MQKRQFKIQEIANKKLVIDTYKAPLAGDCVLTKHEEVQIYSKEHEGQIIGVIIGQGQEPGIINKNII